MPNSRPGKVSTFFKGFWLLSAGILLLGHASVLAEPYLRVCKNGVIYYYFAGQKPGQPMNRSTPPRGEVWIQVSAPPPELPAPATREAADANAAVTPPQGAPGLRGLPPGRAAGLPVHNPYDAKEQIWAGLSYLFGSLIKGAGPLPRALPAYNADLGQVERPQSGPFIQESKALVPEVGKNFLKYGPEGGSELDRAQPGPDYLKESNRLCYSFPVSPPFSFRDTWSDYRPGGRQHRAVDIFAREGAEVYAITAGVIDTLATRNDAGIILLIRGQDGRGYGYMHLQGYAAGIVEGKAVSPGELIGYVGRTGLRESAAHLHFQVYADQRLCRDELLNPYLFLVQLCHGEGVTDLSNQQIARLPEPQLNPSRIRVFRRTAALADRGKPGVKPSSVLVIKNY